ncbi:hypothetical protein KIW84_043375 [Lathyrus oleraceus]|uniref:DUF4219 domain-containing protein n=1 Tax=Pisum sativum TaxID=3888 RepID=A0A9D5AUF1_PEA|nr:hypothetical protein KIW84_043375 [Pisum sativum]
MASTSNSSTVYSNVKVPLFEGENYDFWAVKMETLFTYLDVLEFIQNGYEEPAPTETEESSQRLEELKKKKKITDTGVLMMIQRAVSISIFPRIMRAKISKEAWNILQQEFEGDSKLRVPFNLNSTFNPTMMRIIPQYKIEASLLEVAGLEEAWAEEEARMAKDGMKEHKINGAKYV